jgi:DNA-binding transcriptional LysR family regulator
MKLRDINAFTAVVQTGSVQQAAGKLGLTQSAVTRLIQRLEDEFGITLFDRRSKPFKLTRDGELAFAHATRILRLTAEMADALATSPEPKGPVHIGIAHALAAAVAGQVSTAVRTAFPAVQMHICADWTQRLLKSVSDGVLDAALILLPEDRSPPTDLIAVPLLEDRMVVIGTRGRRTRQQRTLAFLNETGWILNPDGCGYRRALEAALARLNITPNILLEAHGLELHHALAAQGVGYTLQPSRLVDALDKRLAVINVSEFPPLVFRIWAIRGRHISRVSPAIDYLETTARKILGRSKNA